MEAKGESLQDRVLRQCKGKPIAAADIEVERQEERQVLRLILASQKRCQQSY